MGAAATGAWSRLTGSGAPADVSAGTKPIRPRLPRAHHLTTTVNRWSTFRNATRQPLLSATPPGPRWVWAGVHYALDGTLEKCTEAPSSPGWIMDGWEDSPRTAARRQAHCRPASARRPQHVCPPDPPRAASCSACCLCSCRKLRRSGIRICGYDLTVRLRDGWS